MTPSISLEQSLFHRTLFSALSLDDFNTSKLNVYTVLDGASIPDIVQTLATFNAEAICLYRGELDSELAQTAPYLVQLQPETELVDWVLSGIGHHWGIFAISKVNIREMRKHFRHFLMVNDPDNNPMYFRYYDPRVLMSYLPTCNQEELKQIFGPVEQYFIESEDGQTLEAFFNSPLNHTITTQQAI